MHCPGFDGNIGGYPIIINGDGVYIDESKFSLTDMQKKNRVSIYLDGIENVENGVLTYTDELINKVENVCSVRLPKSVQFDEIDQTAEFIIENIIKKFGK